MPLLRDYVFANPGKYLLKRAVVGFQHSDNELLAFVGSKNEFPPVQTQEYVGGEECDSLIAIDEGAIDQQGLEHRCCHFFNMCVVTGLRPKEGTFQDPLVANAVVATKSLDQSLLNCEHFIKRQELNCAIGQVGGPALRSPASRLRGDPLQQDAIGVYVRNL